MQSRPFPTLPVCVGLLAVVVVFFPSLFFGRVISPLDTVLTEPPWQSSHHAVEVTNPELKTAATTFLPRLLEAREAGLATALWSPYRACGGPGWLAWSWGLLSPLVAPLLPWVPGAFLLNGVVLGKLLLAFAGSLALQRRLGRSQEAAVVGAAAFTLAGPLTARWLEPASATVAALPLLLWGYGTPLFSNCLGPGALSSSGIFLGAGPAFSSTVSYRGLLMVVAPFLLLGAELACRVASFFPQITEGVVLWLSGLIAFATLGLSLGLYRCCGKKGSFRDSN